MSNYTKKDIEKNIVFRINRLVATLDYLIKNGKKNSLFEEVFTVFVVIELYSFFDNSNDTISIKSKNTIKELIKNDKKRDLFEKKIKEICEITDNFKLLKKLRNNIAAHKNIDITTGREEIQKMTPHQLEHFFISFIYALDEFIDISKINNYKKLKLKNTKNADGVSVSELNEK
ncbi:hypothetical protein CSB11_01000 [Candidatus Campbellbacteria bacterium]|nr:MAG: hypothetical protein CSB11_01000 [Candidatus Campbellbacteria bacterium]